MYRLRQDGRKFVFVLLEDDILDVMWNESELENDDLKNYKAKAEYYIREHQDNEAIKKLKSNMACTNS